MKEEFMESNRKRYLIELEAELLGLLMKKASISALSNWKSDMLIVNLPDEGMKSNLLYPLWVEI